ncbi:TlpA family protein disulfide reductase [Chryseobacterium wangxinyae]|uniref:TlpA family protein disulfide reductase n=1 Tax=Chryseobacterium sp. CY353 TaxID=2997334 RepID=UPI00226F8E21|nr:TlpA disulfide reductase family protein [Chryseobacterium sp. CY353]MCY0970938.1 TlpA disulfide reductase family protein [Chryseobacterium sp. CY353]
MLKLKKKSTLREKKIFFLFFFLFLTSALFSQEAVYVFPDVKDKIGKHFPIEYFKDSNGENYNSNFLHGKNSLINFWFTNCEPCHQEIPYLIQLQQELGDKVNFMGITFDNKEKVKIFADKKKINFLQITESLDGMNKYGINRYPMSFIIDNEGNVKMIFGIVNDSRIDDVRNQLLHDLK